MKFDNIVVECYNNLEFVKEYNIMTGSSIRTSKTPIEYLIDKSTGKEKDELTKFINFVDEYVWKPLIMY